MHGPLRPAAAAQAVAPCSSGVLERRTEGRAEGLRRRLGVAFRVNGDCTVGNRRTQTEHLIIVGWNRQSRLPRLAPAAPKAILGARLAAAMAPGRDLF